MTTAQRKAFSKQIASLYQGAGGAAPSKAAYDYYLGKGSAGIDLLKRNLAKDPTRLTEEEKFAQSIAGTLPKQPDIPTFENSGLYNEDDAGKLFGSIYDPYFQKQFGGEEQGKTWASEDVARALGRLNEDTTRNLSQGREDIATQDQARLKALKQSQEGLGNAAAQSEQYGSGVYQREQGQLNEQSDVQKQVLDRALGRLEQGSQTQLERGTFDVQNPYNREYGSPYGGYEQRKEALRNKQGITRSGFLSDEESRARQRYADRFQTYTN